MADTMRSEGADPEREALVEEFEAAMRRLYPAARASGRSVATFLHQQIFRHASTATLRALIPEVRRFAERWEAEATERP